jgi:flagellar motor switch protein FliG
MSEVATQNAPHGQNGQTAQKKRGPSRTLGGPRKVAALLLAMNKNSADQLLRRFNVSEIRLIAQSAASLGTVPKQVLDEIVTEFSEALVSGSDLLGTSGEAEHLLTGVLSDEEIANIMASIQGSPGASIWKKLAEVPETSIAMYLTKEHPQVAAFILSEVTSSVAAKVMSRLPATLRNELTRRMLAIKHIMERPLMVLEGVLQEDLLHTATRKAAPNIHARLADIINRLDRPLMEEMLGSLNEHRPKDAKRVNGLLFTFEDIIKLSGPERLKLISQIAPDQLVIALRGADAALSELILSSLGTRGRRMIEQEIARASQVSPKEINKARRSIADVALEMAERGLIDLNLGSEEEA